MIRRTVLHGMLAALALGLGMAAACAQTRQPPALQDAQQQSLQRPFYDVYWCVTGALANQAPPTGMNVRQDIVIFYDHRFGLYPRFAGSEVRNGGIPQATDMGKHLAQVRKDLDRDMPDRNFAGIAVIDYEGWWPDWETQNVEIKRASQQYARQRNPGKTAAQIDQIAKAEFEVAAKSVMLETLLLCKQARPKAKWGYYAYPDLWRPERFATATYAWLWEASDVIMPSIYALKKSVPDAGSPKPTEIKLSDYKKEITDVIALSRRYAGPNKPVLPFVWFRYHDVNKDYANQLVNDMDLDAMMNVPKAAGADGVIIWNHIVEQRWVTDFRNFTQSKAKPLVNAAVKPSASAAAGKSGK